MKKVTISLLVILIGLLIGCIFKDISVMEVKANTDNRFEIIETWEGRNCTFYDKETKVQYYFIQGGVTVLVDANGKPMLYEGE